MTAVSPLGDVRSERPATSRAPKILVVSPVAPVAEGVGGVYMRDLCLMYPEGRLAFAILPGIGHGPWPEPLNAAPRITLDVVPERGFNQWGRRVQQSTRFLFDRYVDRRHLPRAIDRIAAFADDVGPEMLWVPLAGPTMINLAAALAARTHLPLLTTVWDAPDYFLPHYWGIGGASLDRAMRRFAAAVRGSVRCAVASVEMQHAYESAFGTPCIPMIHGLPASAWMAPSGPRPPNAPFVIGYAGSLYARHEWDALLEALASVGWRVAGRDVSVRVLAASVDLRAAGPARVEFLGWRSTSDAVAILSECDICYVPYWFDPACRPAVELCFPNKISLYLAAGRPVLFHGPEQSTPAHFLARHPVGLACHALERREIVRALERAASDAAFHDTAAREIPHVLREELGLQVFRRQFARFVGIDEAALASPA